MKTYNVAITCTVSKIYTVEAKTEDDAYVLAQERFSFDRDGAKEWVEWNTDAIEEVTE